MRPGGSSQIPKQGRHLTPGGKIFVGREKGGALSGDEVLEAAKKQTGHRAIHPLAWLAGKEEGPNE
jgi:hypothetical protein